MSLLPPVINNVTTTLRAAHAPGDGLILVATGTGASFGTTFPIRITCQRANNTRSVVIFYVNSRTNDDLSVSGPIEGTSDIPLAIGDKCQMRLTAGAITEIENKLLYSTTVPTTPTVGGVPAGSTFSNTLLTDLTDQLLHASKVTRTTSSAPANPLPASSWYPFGNPYLLNAMTQNAAYCRWAGGFAAQGNAFFIPLSNGKFLRFKTANFATITPLDLQTINSQWLGFGGGFTDGRYGYLLCVGNSDVVRVDLQTFNAAGTTSIPLGGLDTITGNNNFSYNYFGVTDGAYGYTPGHDDLLLARFSITNFNVSTAQMLDLRPLTGGETWVGGLGIDTDGKNVYALWGDNSNVPCKQYVTATSTSNFTLAGSRIVNLTPWAISFGTIIVIGQYIYVFSYRDIDTGTVEGKILRINTNDFTDVTLLDLSLINPNYIGFQGGFTGSLGRFLYLTPYSRSLAVRVDLNDFQSVDAVDLAPFGVNGGCQSGFSDGRFGYYLQYYDSANQPSFNAGRVIRFQMYNGGHF
jgi:hypothetical protein